MAGRVALKGFRLKYMLDHLEKILLSEEQIDKRVTELAQQLSTDYSEQGVESITIICITNGAIIFTADILRKLNLRTRLDCLKASSYLHGTKPQQEPDIIADIRLDIQDAHVLLLDDILDTGRTCNKIVAALKKKNPASIKSCMLLDKEGRREVPFEADYVGFKIPDEFVVGYGLDFADYYRNLPCIGVLKKSYQIET